MRNLIITICRFIIFARLWFCKPMHGWQRRGKQTQFRADIAGIWGSAVWATYDKPIRATFVILWRGSKWMVAEDVVAYDKAHPDHTENDYPEVPSVTNSMTSICALAAFTVAFFVMLMCIRCIDHFEGHASKFKYQTDVSITKDK